MKNKPLTQADVKTMHFDKVWISYEDGSGEWGVILYGKLYSIEVLEGAGFAEALTDFSDAGETIDRPTGQYRLFRERRFIKLHKRRVE